MAFRWRADAAGPSLNASMITVIFQGIRTRIAENPYIFVIFPGGGGGESGSADALWRRIFWRPSIFFLLVNVPIVVGACLIMLFLVDKRGHLGEKNQLQTTFKCQGRRTVCCVLEQDTFILVLVLVQPRKTRPDISEKLLTGR